MINMSVSFPLDDDGFFRRECPMCLREFKVLLDEDELTSLEEEGIKSFMLDTQDELNDMDEEEKKILETCPYCGQEAPIDSWWTKEQIAYIEVIIQNIMAKVVNEEFLRPINKLSGKYSSGLVTLHFNSNEMKQQEPWISPEVNDMEIFDLPCCHRKIKVDGKWSSTIHCFFCGFPHELGKKFY